MDPGNKEPLTGAKRCGQFFKNYWRMLVTITVPLITLPIFLLNNTPAYRCLYIVVVMSVFWVTEALPLPITSLIPIVALPVFGILDTNTTCQMYFKSTILMFLAGLMIAEAIEFCNLHKRIALATISLVGCSFRRLFTGFIMVTSFISMWMSNTAATAMMCPIIMAVLEEMENEGLCKVFSQGTKPVDVETGPKKGKAPETDNPVPSKITVCFFCGIAYAATIGGSGTLIGTGTNLTFKGIFESRFPTGNSIDFLSFSAYAAPLMFVQAVLVCIWMQIFHMGLFRPKSEEAKSMDIGKEGELIARNIVKARYIELGPISAHEIAVIICFLVVILLLLTREPGFMPSWAKAITDKKLQDASVCVFIVIVFFLIPSSWECLRFFTRRTDVPRYTTQPLITWAYINKKTSWGLLLLLGAGFALAEAGKQSGMSKMIGESLSVVESLDRMVILFLTILFVKILTEFSTNVAVANIILPVLAEMALVIHIHPLYLMLPAALACSMAFHLPVGTPPNALIAGYAYIRPKDFMIAGIGPTIIVIITLWICAISWGRIIFPYSNDFPKWASEEIEHPPPH